MSARSLEEVLQDLRSAIRDHVLAGAETERAQRLAERVAGAEAFRAILEGCIRSRDPESPGDTSPRRKAELGALEARRTSVEANLVALQTELAAAHKAAALEKARRFDEAARLVSDALRAVAVLRPLDVRGAQRAG